MSHQAPRANRLKIVARYVSLLVAAALCVVVGAADPTATIVPLGARQSGGTYPLTLSAKNESCPQPLDFRFTSHAPWIRLPNDPVARQVPQGQTRDLNATLDFTAIGPGTLRGNVTVECVNCGWFLFQNCTVDRQDLSFEVQVVPRDPSKPYAQPARPGDAKPSILPYSPPQEAIDRLNAAQAALAAAETEEKRCKERLAALRQDAAKARDQAERDRKDADFADAVVKAVEAQAFDAAADVLYHEQKLEEAKKKAREKERLEADLDSERMKLEYAFGGDKAKKVDRAYEDAKRDHAEAKKERKGEEEAVAKSKSTLSILQQRLRDERALAAKERKDADASEKRARDAEAKVKAAEDECARLKKAVDDARVDVEIAQLELDKARRGEK